MSEINVVAGTQATVIHSDEEVADAWAEMKQWARIIREAKTAGEFPPTPGSHCSYCSYRASCPVAQSTSDSAPI
jgi:hypothetical protein